MRSISRPLRIVLALAPLVPIVRQHCARIYHTYAFVVGDERRHEKHRIIYLGIMIKLTNCILIPLVCALIVLRSPLTVCINKYGCESACIGWKRAKKCKRSEMNWDGCMCEGVMNILMCGC